MPHYFERERKIYSLESDISWAQQAYAEDRNIGLLILRHMSELLPDSKSVKETVDRHGVSCFKSVVKDMPLQESLLYYIDFINVRTDRRRYHDEILDNLADKLENLGELSGIDKWLVEVVIDSVSEEKDELIEVLSSAYYIRPMMRILGKRPEVRERLFSVVMDFVRDSGSDCKEDIFSDMYSKMGASLSFRFIGEYIREATDYDTFFSGKLFENIIDILESETRVNWREKDWNQVDTETVRALERCFVNIEEAIPDLDKRGHTKIVLRGADKLIGQFPEVKTLMGDGLLRSIKGLKEKRSAKKAGRLAGKLDDSHHYLSQLYDSSPTSSQTKLSRIIEKEEDKELFEILSQLFTSRESQDLDDCYLPTRSEVRQIRECLSKNELVLELMGLMADNPEYRFQMGVLLSMMDFSDLPARLKRRLNVEQTECNHRLWVKNELWFLCDEAEPRMAEAMYNGGVMLVNENLLVKFNGELSAMCLRTFTSKEGFTFLKENQEEILWLLPWLRQGSYTKKTKTQGFRR